MSNPVVKMFVTMVRGQTAEAAGAVAVADANAPPLLDPQISDATAAPAGRSPSPRLRGAGEALPAGHRPADRRSGRPLPPSPGRRPRRLGGRGCRGHRRPRSRAGPRRDAQAPFAAEAARLRRIITATDARIDFGREDKVFNALPVFHSFGLTAGLVPPLPPGVLTFLYTSPLHHRVRLQRHQPVRHGHLPFRLRPHRARLRRALRPLCVGRRRAGEACDARGAAGEVRPPRTGGLRRDGNGADPGPQHAHGQPLRHRRPPSARYRGATGPGAGHRGRVRQPASGSRWKRATSMRGDVGDRPTWSVELGEGTACSLARDGPRGEFVAVGLSGNAPAGATGERVTALDAHTSPRLRVASWPAAAIEDLAFSPDRRLLAAASRGDEVRVPSAATGEMLLAFGGPRKPRAVAWGPAGPSPPLLAFNDGPRARIVLSPLRNASAADLAFRDAPAGPPEAVVEDDRPSLDPTAAVAEAPGRRAVAVLRPHEWLLHRGAASAATNGAAPSSGPAEKPRRPPAMCCSA